MTSGIGFRALLGLVPTDWELGIYIARTTVLSGDMACSGLVTVGFQLGCNCGWNRVTTNLYHAQEAWVMSATWELQAS